MATKPQDHKPTQSATQAEKQANFDEIDGHELLKPFSKVKGSDQLRLLSQLKNLGVMDDSEGDEIDIDDLDLEKVADLIDYVGDRFAVDVDAFEEFTTGAGGYERAMNLAIAYAGELGKGDA